MFDGIQEESSMWEIKEVLKYFTNTCIKQWLIPDKIQIGKNMNKVVYDEFTAYEKYMEPDTEIEPEKKMSSAPEVAIKENRIYDSLEVFKNVSDITRIRGINYDTLKNNMWTRVIKVESWYVLSEDIVAAYKKDYWLE